jgi:hypothetical protein
MTAPTLTAISHVKIRCFTGGQLDTRKSHMELNRTGTTRKNEETAVMKVCRRFGIDSAPFAAATANAATKALVVLGLIISKRARPTDRVNAAAPINS